MKKHKATTISVKKARIDKEIQPLVKWINSFDGVFSRWCCEGDYIFPNIFNGYLTFYCDNTEDLIKICKYTYSFCDIEVDAFSPVKNSPVGLRYTMRFVNRENLFNLMAKIKNDNG